MNLTDVMKEIATQLDTIVGLRVAEYPDGPINPPCAVVCMPADPGIEFDDAYGRGSDHMTIPVVVMVGGSSTRTAWPALAVYCNGTGSSSVKAVIEAGTYTAFDSVRVASVAFDVWTNGASEYPAAIFSLDITGSGS